MNNSGHLRGSVHIQTGAELPERGNASGCIDQQAFKKAKQVSDLINALPLWAGLSKRNQYLPEAHCLNASTFDLH